MHNPDTYRPDDNPPPSHIEHLRADWPLLAPSGLTVASSFAVGAPERSSHCLGYGVDMDVSTTPTPEASTRPDDERPFSSSGERLIQIVFPLIVLAVLVWVGMAVSTWFTDPDGASTFDVFAAATIGAFCLVMVHLVYVFFRGPKNESL